MEEEDKRHLEQEESVAAEPRQIWGYGRVRSTGDWGGKDLETTTAHLQTSGSHRVGVWACRVGWREALLPISCQFGLPDWCATGL